MSWWLGLCHVVSNGTLVSPTVQVARNHRSLTRIDVSHNRIGTAGKVCERPSGSFCFWKLYAIGASHEQKFYECWLLSQSQCESDFSVPFRQSLTSCVKTTSQTVGFGL